MTTNPVKLAIDAAGSQAQLARALGLSRAAISQWREIPVKRVLEIERVTGVSREQLRPDLYAGRGAA